MDITIEVDLGHAARELNLPLESVRRTVALLDEGNTVPFITRYRKDQTGSLDEEQIRKIEDKVGKLRGLAERKQTILRSLQNQNLLTDELRDLIRQANSLKRLEDLYLPYKPKKQTLATAARRRGLEPLALEVLQGPDAGQELSQRAEALIDAEQGLATIDDVLQGVQHIIAEMISERADVRGRLRKIVQRTGKLVSSRQEKPPADPNAAVAGAERATERATEQATEQTGAPASAPAATPAEVPAPDGALSTPTGEAAAIAPVPSGQQASEAEQAEGTAAPQPQDAASPGAADAQQTDQPSAPPADLPPPAAGSDAAVAPATPASDSAELESAQADPSQDELSEISPSPTSDSAGSGEGTLATEPQEPGGSAPPSEPIHVMPAPQESAAQTGEAPPKSGKKSGKKSGDGKHGPLHGPVTKKEKKRQRLEAAFKDYYDYQESVTRIPPHRVLAINRGERSRILRVKLDVDMEAMNAEARRLVIPEDHPHRDFLEGCVRDSLQRLLVPSLERELRREMTDQAEQHAVEVFARNLRKLLLQPPVYQHRVLAIDPGFRSGCKLIALDQFGNVLDHRIIHVIGKEEWIRKGREKLVDLIRRHCLSVVAIGNGAACRETEQLVVDVMERELKDQDLSFVIVNEAGASVYSTSPLGREELPGYDAVLRSAISIGRRLLDPLSELVKINPANIGVGMYQHDVKAKHLQKSLDAVVESCVNFVGVDVNTASPALLRYVSGMNQLTARRLCEYRAAHGPFHDREQLKQVPGLGEATFIQAAGFLKIANGDNPLDATWIHPESYELARRVLEAVDCNIDQLRPERSDAQPERQSGAFSLDGPQQQPSVDQGSSPETTTPLQPPAAAAPASDLSPTVPETPVPEEPGSAAPTPEAAVPEAAVPEAPVPEAPVPEAPVPEAPVPEAAVLEEPGSAAPTPEAAVPAEPMPEGQDDQAPTAQSCGESTQVEPLAPAPPAEVRRDRWQQLAQRLGQLEPAALAAEWSINGVVLQDVFDLLARPGRDPREDLPAPVFRRGIVKLEDLEPGMRLAGTVLNVVDFGAFVDIGLSDSGLVHISRLADRFVRDPHEIVGVGDVLQVWVVDVDKQRRRVSLTAIEPGTEKPPQARRSGEKSRRREGTGKRPRGKKPAGGHRPARSGAAPDRERKRRPPRKPKIVPPITKEMEEGTEPLRSFSDLMQFYQKKQSDENDSKS